MPAESPSPLSRFLTSRSNLIEAVVLVSFASVGVAMRVIRGAMLDPFEDGYQRWWISANLLQTGQHVDTYSMMTQGNWLPLYDYVGAALLGVFGVHNIWAMKGFNILLSVGLMGLAYLMGRRVSKATGILAFAFMVFSPPDMILGTTASPDTLGVFSILLAVYCFASRPLGQRRSLVVSSAFFLIGVATVYEAWFALLVFLGYYAIKERRKFRWREISVVAVPALVFCAAWWIYTMQWGFLPSIIISQTSVDVGFQVQAGTQPSQLSQFLGFWFAYIGHFAAVFALSVVYLVYRGWREVEGAIYSAFLIALVAYSVLRVGQPAPRYIYVTILIATVFAARAITGGCRRLARSAALKPVLGGVGWNARKTVVMGLALTVVFASVGYDAWRVLAPANAPGVYLQPRQRAGEYMANVTVPSGKLVVFESPMAAYYSNLPPSEMIGSRLLPRDRQAAEQFLHGKVAYVVYVDVPYYPLNEMFPELEAGRSVGIFELAYNANSWEADFGAHLVYVYAVNATR